MKNDVIEHLEKLKFIGPFPHGVDVLLVSAETALSEARLIDKDITLSKLKTLLDNEEILIFNTIEDWIKFKEPKKCP